jgi:hypothetical protein
MQKLLCLTIGAILLAGGAIRAADQPEVALRAAMQKEIVDGDLPGAIQMYESIAQGSDRVTAARALLRMGRCYEQLGDPQARKAYERVVSQFADQKDAAQEARKRLAALPGGAPAVAPVKTAQDQSGPTVGWYNGDWQSGIPGLANWYHSKQEYSSVYDAFVVPEGGWTVVAVFSNSRMVFEGVKKASWEIRTDMSPGHGGKLVASGVSPATQTVIPGNGPFPGDPLVGYRVQVDDLRVSLPAGRYWLSVAPVATGESFLNATRHSNAVGNSPDDSGVALFDATDLTSRFTPADMVGRGGQLGIGRSFSQGVLISNSPR